MAEHAGRIGAAAMIGVGAAFDFHSGNVPWAPRWIRKLGIEWAYRLMLEPRRMWRRNLDSPKFLAIACSHRVRKCLTGSLPLLANPRREAESDAATSRAPQAESVAKAYRRVPR